MCLEQGACRGPVLGPLPSSSASEWRGRVVAQAWRAGGQKGWGLGCRMGREGRGAGTGLKYKVDDINIWGRVRADGAARSHHVARWGRGGRRSCRILCEWRPLRLCHSSPVCVGACNRRFFFFFFSCSPPRPQSPYHFAGLTER